MSNPHTPIWAHTDFMGGKARNGKRSIITRDGMGIAETMNGGEEGKSDAALIVRAVNSHAVLVEALRQCTSPIAGYAVKDAAQALEVLSEFLDHIRKVDAIARAALAQLDKP